MAPVTLHLIIADQPKDFLNALRALPPASRPLYIGSVHHWMHAPTTLSTAALLGNGETITQWHFLIIYPASSPESLDLPSGLQHHVREKWSITAGVSDDLLANFAAAQAKRVSNAVPPLPAGWSATDYSGLDASIPPADVEASLALEAYSFGSNNTSDSPVVLKDWIRAFGTKHTGPVQMLNLDCCNPGRRPDFYSYIMAFSASVGSRYGGDATVLSFGQDVTEWSTRKEEGELTVAEAKESEKGYGTRKGQVAGWEDVALVWYPSIWHFAKLLDDPEYAEADRKFKVGVLRDGPIVCCTEVEMNYE
ncbi:hypothetical protein LTR97_002090 [Elasticomyces elasticus]|uniref:Uncharacterized protein n=1 Tax=Elasticomyces elasticus TaxID=574655 RepID=A0AAN8A485_9PEZI|nr:hypothetical protein LTR97_002090 [Elasticomyces elasticus]